MPTVTEIEIKKLIKSVLAVSLITLIKIWKQHFVSDKKLCSKVHVTTLQNIHYNEKKNARVSPVLKIAINNRTSNFNIHHIIK